MVMTTMTLIMMMVLRMELRRRRPTEAVFSVKGV